MTCVNINDMEFQTLVLRSGVPESIVKAYSGWYLDKYERFPYLDEIPNANSEPYLRDFLKIKKSGYCNIDTILTKLGVQSIDEAVIKINNEFRDLEVDFSVAGDIAHVSITRRPNINENKQSEPTKINKINSTVAFNKIFEKLNKLYGINLIPITIDELTQPEWEGVLDDAKYTKGFVYNGNIYINTDIATLDTPIHELLHIMLGSIRFQEPKLYMQLVSSIEQLKDFPNLLKQQEGKTRNDAYEEIFISEFAKVITNGESEFTELPEETIKEIFYNINRILDSMLMGDVSTRLIDTNILTNMSLIEIAKKVNSKTLENRCQFSLDDATIHRIAANEKQNLMKKGELEEFCE